MPALRELQLAFTAALFDERDSQVLQHIRADDVGASERLDIYRNNLREGFHQGARPRLPRDPSGWSARTTSASSRWSSASFIHRGREICIAQADPFPWLRKRFASSPYAYFADVAALEWAHQEALIAG